MKNHSLLMIPGPVEFDSEVLSALGSHTPSHVSLEFIDVFAQVLEKLREIFLCPDGQPFVLAGSGTLAMDSVSANLVEPGDKSLVVSTGYFSDRFGQILERYGSQVTYIKSPVGGRPSLDQVEQVLKSENFKLFVITHVDTSTGVINAVANLAGLAHQYGPLIIVDGVCSVAGEELSMLDWNIDVALTASQKAIGVPPGLALIVARPRALDAFKTRIKPVLNYYADWSNWLPIMESYAARKPSYFATPPVNLIAALNVSLSQILAEGMQARVQRHYAMSQACKAGIQALGLGQVPLRPEFSANTMTAPRFPVGVTSNEFLNKVLQEGVTLASGLHPDIRAQYFRVGHMGRVTIGDILTTLAAIETALQACGYTCETGVAVTAALKTYNNC
jgi:alanine-glyoxylate transaminase / serine-glyoxylate transaminase / serine-pyruvate transaminase